MTEKQKQKIESLTKKLFKACDDSDSRVIVINSWGKPVADMFEDLTKTKMTFQSTTSKSLLLFALSAVINSIKEINERLYEDLKNGDPMVWDFIENISSPTKGDMKNKLSELLSMFADLESDV